MSKITIERFAQGIAGALGARLVSLLLYGSAARGAEAPADTLLLCDDVDEDLFARIAPIVAAWTRAGHPAPLIMTAAEWRASADAFPIEYEDMRQHHRVLAGGGGDPWGGIAVHRDHVRRQLEHELKGKLVRLRQAYAALHADPRRLGQVLEGSVAGFLTMVRAALRLAGRQPEREARALLRQGAALVGWNADDLTRLVATPARRTGLKLSRGDPLPAAYLAALARTADYVNHLT